jgi:hypothetical protein
VRLAILILALAGCQPTDPPPQLPHPTYQDWLDASDTAREIAAEKTNH